jgi:hypothetical protein
MSQLHLDFPPPSNWQDFERLTRALCQIEWGDNEVQILGRPGQPQHGVDVVGWDHRGLPRSRVAVQCKRRSQSDAAGEILAGGLVDMNDVTASLKAAENLSPSLNLLVIATTASQDTGFQQQVDTLSASRHQGGECDIKVWFWEWFQDRLNRHFEVAATYYESVLRANNMYNMDRHVASVLRSGFNRPFMRTNFVSENQIGHFMSAIRSLQQLLATGRLTDADGNAIYSCPAPRSMRSAQDTTCISEIEDRLQKLRDDVTTCLQSGDISQVNDDWVQVSDWRISDRLNAHRAAILAKLNELLSRHGIDALTSPLIA